MNFAKILSLKCMNHIIKENALVFLLYTVILVSGTGMAVSVPKLELHAWLNSEHTVNLDLVFRALTFLGDGWFAAMVAVLFILIRFRYSIMVASASLASGFLAQFLKRVVFREMDRPAAYLEQMPDLALVSGVDLHHHFSFPSGHTTTAFAILVLAGLISGKRWIHFVMMLLAWAVGLSRVYLSQHFLMDVLAGSFLGLLSALLFYWYFQRMNWRWLNKSVIHIRRP